MDPTLKALALTGLAGAAIPIGGALAAVEHIQPRWLEQELRHGIIAFGGGVLLAAVALVLVPEGVAAAPLGLAAAAFAGGGLVFLALDMAVARAGASLANLVAALADFVPEAVALGASLAAREPTTLLLALLIALQNLPEGFNAYREMVSAGSGRWRVLWAMAATALLGPLAGLLGLHVLVRYPTVVGALMLLSAGGILYVLFQDIAPQARLARRWIPPFGAVLGFLAGLVGQQLLH